MALPAGIATVTVTVGPYLASDGGPASGRVRFVPEGQVLHSPSGSVILPDAVTVTLDDAGVGQVTVVASDAAGVTPSPFAYWVYWDLPGRAAPAPLRVLLPAAVPTVDLDALLPAASGTGLIAAPAVSSVAGLAGAVSAANLTEQLATPLAGHPTIRGTLLPAPFLKAFGPDLVPAIAGPMLNTVSTASAAVNGGGITYELGYGDNQYAAVTDVFGIAPVFSNWTVDTPNPNPITLRVSASNDGGSTWRRVLFGGQSSVTIEPDADVRADFLPLEIAKGGLLGLRVQVTVASTGQSWSTGQVCNSSAAGTTDNTLTAGQGWIANWSIYGYGPTAILCWAARQPVLIGLIGDSIMNGENDWPNTRGGFTQGVTAAGVPFVKISRIGEAPSAFAAPGTRRRRTKFLTGPSHLLCEYGSNGMAGQSGPGTVANQLVTIWKAMSGRGARVYQSTITPSTTSTDAYATTTNQTPRSGFAAARYALNDWIRAGAPVDGSGAYVAPGTAGAVPCPYLSGYVEVADAVESARNSGVWKIGMVNLADGLHPSAAGHLLIAPVVQAWAAALTA